jgi:hypothetical protein
MDRITINRIDIHLFMIMTNGLTHKRTCTSNMTVGQDDAIFGIHNKARSF